MPRVTVTEATTITVQASTTIMQSVGGTIAGITPVVVPLVPDQTNWEEAEQLSLFD
jgi:hypothetical protein